MFNFIFGLLTGSIIGIFIQCVVKPKPLALAMGISDTSIEFTQVIEDGLNGIYHRQSYTRSSELIY